jgi:hypothetical protein
MCELFQGILRATFSFWPWHQWGCPCRNRPPKNARRRSTSVQGDWLGPRNYGKSQFFMGKSTMSIAMFNSFLYVYRRVPRIFWWTWTGGQATFCKRDGYSSPLAQMEVPWGKPVHFLSIGLCNMDRLWVHIIQSNNMFIRLIIQYVAPSNVMGNTCHFVRLTRTSQSFSQELTTCHDKPSK